MFIFQIVVLKVKIVNVGLKHFSSQGGTRSFLSVVYFCATGEVCSESLSQPFLFHRGFFLVYLTYKDYLGSFWIFFQRHLSLIGCRFNVSIKGGEFRSLLCRH